MTILRHHRSTVKHDETADAWRGLPAAICERLRSEGIKTAAAWLRLSERERRSVFGVTPAMVRTIDRAADTAAGVAWWNELSEPIRALYLRQADTPAEAWATYKAAKK